MFQAAWVSLYKAEDTSFLPDTKKAAFTVQDSTLDFLTRLDMLRKKTKPPSAFFLFCFFLRIGVSSQLKTVFVKLEKNKKREVRSKSKDSS